MFRSTFFLLAAICLAAHGASASSTVVKRDILSLLLGGENGDDSIVTGLSDIASVVLTVKNHVKEIFEDIFLQCLKQFLEFLRNLKIRLLKKIGQYTLASVFRIVFDGVADFVSEDEVVVVAEPTTTTTEEPSYQYKHRYVAPHVLYGK